MLGYVSVAAAVAVVTFDLCSNQSWRLSPSRRRIVAVGLAGSAAALDTAVDVFVGNTKVGTLYNAATGAVTKDHMFRIGTPVPGGQEVHLYVTDAPATNPLNAVVDFED